MDTTRAHTGAGSTPPAIPPPTFAAAMQSEMDAAFRPAFARLMRAARELAANVERHPGTGRVVGPVTALCRLAIAAGDVMDVCRDWRVILGAGISAGMSVANQLKPREFALLMAALRYVAAQREHIWRVTAGEGQAEKGTRAEVDRLADAFLDAALATGYEQ